MKDRFFAAVREGDLQTIKNLVETQQINPQVRNLAGLTAMHIAAKTGNIAIMDYLNSQGLSYEIEDTRGWAPLYYALINGQTAVETHIRTKISNADTQENFFFSLPSSPTC